jgi:hypothetical protein
MAMIRNRQNNARHDSSGSGVNGGQHAPGLATSDDAEQGGKARRKNFTAQRQ